MSLRRMTSGELTLARSIFENTIDYNKVWIHNEKPLPGQGERTAMTQTGKCIILMLFIVQIFHRKQCLAIVKQ